VAQTAGNIVLPGPCKVFIAAHSTSALEAAPTASIAKGTDWGGGWVEVGYTVGGVVLKPEAEHLTPTFDQVNAAVVDHIIKQSATVTFAAGEATLTNMKQAMGYGTVTAGSTESTLGVSGTDAFPTYYSVGFECFATNATAASAKYRRAVVWKALPKGEFELSAKKEELMAVGYQLEARHEAQAAATERLWKLIDRVV